MRTRTPRAKLRYYLRALWRDTRVLISQFRVSLFAFAVLVFVGTLALHFLYVDPQTNRQGVSWANAFHATYRLIFWETLLDFPEEPLFVQTLFILIPLVGLAVVADGVLRFGVALFDRRERKEAWQVAVASTYHSHVVGRRHRHRA